MLLTHQPNSQKSAIVNRNRLLDGKEIYSWAIFASKVLAEKQFPILREWESTEP